MIPANSIAETIVALREDSGFYQAQIDKNAELITQLEPLAEWTEEPEQAAPLEESAPGSSN
jgi:hypothetical protein